MKNTKVLLFKPVALSPMWTHAVVNVMTIPEQYGRVTSASMSSASDSNQSSDSENIETEIIS